MALERKVFRGIGAVIAAVTNDDEFKVMPLTREGQQPEFNRVERLIEIDLKRTPSRAASWDDVRFDDRGIDKEGTPLPPQMSVQTINGYRVTSLGSGMIEGKENLVLGSHVGGVYIEDNHFKTLLPQINDDPTEPWPSVFQKYELTTIHYSKNKAQNGKLAGKRFAGFHARIKRRADRFAQIEVLRPITHKPVRTFWVNQSSEEECEPNPPNDGEVLLDVNSPVKAVGGIYLELGLVAMMELADPKMPIGLG